MLSRVLSIDIGVIEHLLFIIKAVLCFNMHAMK